MHVCTSEEKGLFLIGINFLLHLCHIFQLPFLIVFYMDTEVESKGVENYNVKKVQCHVFSVSIQ